MTRADSATSAGQPWCGCAAVAIGLLLAALVSCTGASDGALWGAGGGGVVERSPLTAPEVAAPPSQGTGVTSTAALRRASLAVRQAAADARYDVREGEAGRLLADNPSQRFGFELSDTTVELQLREGASLRLRWTGLGRDGAVRPIGNADASELRGNRVSLDRASSTEWYLNGPAGLEQGFDLFAIPPGDGPVVLEVTFAGLTPALAGGGEVELRDAGGRVRLRYTDLHAEDARDGPLPASMAVVGQAVQLRVQDDDAAYPLRIDPLVWAEQQKLTPSVVSHEAFFGFSVSVSGEAAVVGAPGSDSAYVFVRNGAFWSEQAALTPSDVAWMFGSSVSLSGETVIVGAVGDDDGGTDSGAAYVFVRNGMLWSEQAKLTASDGVAHDNFGSWVSVSGATAVVGAPGADDGGTDGGAAYVFVRSAAVWSEQAKLTASDASANDRFGRVSVSGEIAVVGAPGDADAGYATGSTYVFVRSAAVWSEQAKLTASDAAADDYFGGSVSLSGEMVMVGAERDDDGGERSGSTYVFVRSAAVWSEQAKLTASDAAPDAHFGRSVNASGETAVVGAPGTAERAYVFVRSAAVWSEQAMLTTSDPSGGDGFGTSVGVSSETAVVGADAKYDGAIKWCGAAYVFALLLDDGSSCSAAGECASGHCVDGLCCDSACGGGDTQDCLACTAALTGSADGVCAPLPDQASCADDGLFCTGAESCQVGACVSAGDPCAPDADDGDADCSEACNEAADDCTAPEPDGTPCQDDGIFCNGRKSCEAGACSQHSGDPCAVQVGDADDDCSESCSEQEEACTANDPDDSPCGSSGRCSKGVCEAPLGAPCADNSTCQSGHCTDEVCCNQASCGAYRCSPTGDCYGSCSSNLDCATGHECTGDRRCVPLANALGAIGGCGCQVSGYGGPYSRLGGLAALALALLGVRRRRRNTSWTLPAH